MGVLEGKVAVITGAGGGIGRAEALAFAREGAKVVVNDLGGERDGRGGTPEAAGRVVDEIRAAGGEAIASSDDVAERGGAERIVAAAMDGFGRVDILVNNAGILRDKTLLKLDDELFDSVVRVHLRGSFLCTQIAALRMRAQGEGGRIINTTSVSGLMGNFGQSNYAAAKAGIYGLTRTAALELQRYGITVNALAPVAHTRMTADLPMMQAMSNAADLLSADHVAPAAVFLASDLAHDITGQVVAVEGPRIYQFKMVRTPPATPRAEYWTPEELRERWSEISQDDEARSGD